MPQADPKAAAEFMRTPTGFALGVLGLPVYEWQAEVLEWFADPSIRTQGAVTTPNGAGKSSGIVAALSLWWVALHKRGKVVITTKDGKQLTGQLIPAITKHLHRFKGWTHRMSPTFELETPTGGKITAFTTTDAGRAEGWHKEDDVNGPLLVIVDEAKSVQEQIFEALDRCTFNALLYVSSPGLMMGAFYNAFTRNKALFRTRKVSLQECPHIPKERIENVVRKYGADHPLTRSSIYGEFTDQDAATAFVFPLGIVDRALENPPQYKVGGNHVGRSFFLDFAAGGDENIIVMREGNRVTIEDAWRDTDTMRAAARFVATLNRLKAKPHEVFGDETGLGKAMCDRLRDLGFDVNRVNNGGTPSDKAYYNRGSEIWHETSAAMTRGEIVIPVDDDLKAQLTSRKSVIRNDGKLWVEPKETMAKRGLPSPDRADAVCGAWVCRPYQPQGRENFFDEWASEFGDQNEEAYTATGAWAG